MQYNIIERIFNLSSSILDNIQFTYYIKTINPLVISTKYSTQVSRIYSENKFPDDFQSTKTFRIMLIRFHCIHTLVNIIHHYANNVCTERNIGIRVHSRYNAYISTIYIFDYLLKIYTYLHNMRNY